MRCPNCNKFASMEFNDPELEEVSMVGGEVSASVRIVRSCADCGTELKEATLEMSEVVPDDKLKGHVKEDGGDLEGHELDVDAEDPEQIEEGGGRYKKSFFGASVDYRVTCSCQKEGSDPIHEGSVQDKVAASEMDEMA